LFSVCQLVLDIYTDGTLQ